MVVFIDRLLQYFAVNLYSTIKCIPGDAVQMYREIL